MPNATLNDRVLSNMTVTTDTIEPNYAPTLPQPSLCCELCKFSRICYLQHSHGERVTSAKRNSFCHWPSNGHRSGLHQGTASQHHRNLRTAVDQPLQIVSRHVTMTYHDKTCQNMPKQHEDDHRCAGRKSVKM